MKVILVYDDHGRLVERETGRRWPRRQPRLKSSATRPNKGRPGPAARAGHHPTSQGGDQ